MRSQPTRRSRLPSDFPDKSIAGWRADLAGAIGDRGVLQRYERKQVIFHQGDVSDSVYAVKSGVVEIVSLSRAGQEVMTATHGPNEAFGWSECVLKEQRVRQAAVLEDAEIWRLSGHDFLQMLLERPTIMLAALMSVLHRGTRIDEMRSEFLGASAYVRVDYVLRQLAISNGHSSDGTGPQIRITHEEIGRACELSRQTVTTILGEMQRSGIVELGLRSIRVIDPTWLHQVSTASGRPQ